MKFSFKKNWPMLLGAVLVITAGTLVASIFLQHDQDDQATDDIMQALDRHERWVEISTEPVDEEDLDFHYDPLGAEDSAASPTETAPPVSGSGYRQVQVLGRLKIDKINVDMPVVEGAGTGELRAALGHVTNSAMFGQQGNCVIAGHRMYTYGRHFNRLDEVELGDLLELTDFDGITYTYKVSEIVILEPGDKALFDYENGTSQLTLVTCHPVVVASHRLIVRALLQ